MWEGKGLYETLFIFPYLLEQIFLYNCRNRINNQFKTNPINYVSLINVKQTLIIYL